VNKQACESGRGTLCTAPGGGAVPPAVVVVAVAGVPVAATVVAVVVAVAVVAVAVVEAVEVEAVVRLRRLCSSYLPVGTRRGATPAGGRFR
jgi:hypothetical protein